MGIFDLLDTAKLKATAKIEAIQKKIEKSAEQLTSDKPSVPSASEQTIMHRDSFIKNGFTQYEYIANKNCCEICAALDGKHFPTSKLEIGVNAPPMHDGCCCSIAAYEDDEEHEAWLDFLDKGGTTKQWEAKKKKKR